MLPTLVTVRIGIIAAVRIDPLPAALRIGTG